jgi:colanic acid/amylovoran biosynthesis glycosyltransferase
MTIALILPQPPAYSEIFFRSKIRDLIESGNEVTLVKAKKQLKSYILNL